MFPCEQWVNRQIAGDFATMAVWTQFDALGDVAAADALAVVVGLGAGLLKQQLLRLG